MKNFLFFAFLFLVFSVNGQLWRHQRYDCSILEAISLDTTIKQYLLKKPDKLGRPRFINFSKKLDIIRCETDFDYLDPKAFTYRNTPQVDLNDRQQCDITILSITRVKRSKVIRINVFFIDFCHSKNCHKMMGELEFVKVGATYNQISSKFSIFD